MTLTPAGWPDHAANSKVRLAAIVSSFNRLSLLKVCLPSLISALAACPFKSAVVVFEAGSTDGSSEWLQQYQECENGVPIDILKPENGADSSFSAGVNFAASYATTKYAGVQWLFLYETDNWLASCHPLLKAQDLLASNAALAAAGYTVLKHSGAAAGYGCRFPTAWQMVLGQNITHLLRLDSCRPRWRKFDDTCRWSECDVVFTSPILITRSAWEKSGGFDAAHFPFADCDLDWARRLHQLGLKLAVIDTEAVVHDNLDQLSLWSKHRAVQFHRGRWQYLRRHNGAWIELLKPFLFVRHCLELLFLSLLVLLKQRPPQLLPPRKALVASVFSDYRLEQKS